MILHILIELYVFQHSATLPGHDGSFKNSQNAIKSAKKEDFGRFLDLGLLDRLDIADFDRSKCPSTFAKVARSQRIVQK